jgi:hypothetical protein
VRRRVAGTISNTGTVNTENRKNCRPDPIGFPIKEAKGSNVKKLSDGRTAYWNDKEKMVVIRDPRGADGGTAFRPRDGKVYFDTKLR